MPAKGSQSTKLTSFFSFATIAKVAEDHRKAGFISGAKARTRTPTRDEDGEDSTPDDGGSGGGSNSSSSSSRSSSTTSGTSTNTRKRKADDPLHRDLKIAGETFRTRSTPRRFEILNIAEPAGAWGGQGR